MCKTIYVQRSCLAWHQFIVVTVQSHDLKHKTRDARIHKQVRMI